MPRPLAHRKLTPKVASLLRLSDAALRSGLAWGGLMALGLGVHALCVVYRGRRMWGVDGAAAAAAASAVGAGALWSMLCCPPAEPFVWSCMFCKLRLMHGPPCSGRNCKRHHLRPPSACRTRARTPAPAVHHLSRSPRTWPLPKPVKGHLQGMAWTFFIAAVVLDELLRLGGGGRAAQSRSGSQGGGGRWVGSPG